MLFSEARAAFVQDPSASCKLLGLVLHTSSSKNWLKVDCPLCEDKSGSAGLSIDSGYLKCHQCGTALELFSWVRELKGLATSYEAARFLGDQFHIPRPAPKKGVGRVPAHLTEEWLRQAEERLWGEPNTWQSQLAERRFGQSDLEWARLCMWDRPSGILFPNWDENGQLQERAHCWHGRIRKKWSWQPRKSDASPLSLWPGWIPPQSDEVWLFEGEWDVICARSKFGLDAYTWTGGASSVVHPDSLPSWLRNRKLNLCYDLDVFRGPGVSVPQVAAAKSLLTRTGPMFVERLQCEVSIRMVPLDQKEFPKGDFRDWWMKEGDQASLAALSAFSLDEAWTPLQEAPFQTTIFALQGLDGKRIRMSGTAVAISEDHLVAHTELTVSCGIGESRACERCLVWSSYPDGKIRVDADRLYGAIWGTSALETNLRSLLHPGRGCPGYDIAELVKIDPKTSKRLWPFRIAPPLEEEGKVSIAALAEKRPDVAIDYDFIGRVHICGSKPVVHVEQFEEKRHEPYHMDPVVAGELRSLCPWQADQPEQVMDYLEARHSDLAANVTGIFGTQWGLAFDIVVHSCLELSAGERGWVDACLIGFTRTGKTETVRQLVGHYGLPASFVTSVQGNVSRSGLISTVERVPGEGSTMAWRARPGLFPRRDGKLVVLDEFHFLGPRDNWGRSRSAELINELQSARDRGFLDVAKAAQGRFRARCRLLTIANPPRRTGFTSYTYPCLAVRDLYGPDETISRLDFALVVEDQDSQIVRHEAPHLWTSRLASELRKRAWGITADRVHISPDAVSRAQQIASDWAGIYTSTLPLYTEQEKWRSILRIAGAIANLRFSHVDDPNHCVIQEVDVVVAATWLEETYEISGFRAYCTEDLQRPLPDVLVIEACFHLWCQDEQDLQKLRNLHGAMAAGEIADRLGIGSTDRVSAQKWIARMLSCCGLEIVTGQQSARYILSDAGKAVADAMRHAPFDERRRDWLLQKHWGSLGHYTIPSEAILKPLPGLEQWL